MDAGQKTDRPPEQIVREVGLCLCTSKALQALCPLHDPSGHYLTQYVMFRQSFMHKGIFSDMRCFVEPASLMC